MKERTYRRHTHPFPLAVSIMGLEIEKGARIHIRFCYTLQQEFSVLPRACSVGYLPPALYLRTAKAVHITSLREKFVWFTHTLHAVVQSF